LYCKLHLSIRIVLWFAFIVIRFLPLLSTSIQEIDLFTIEHFEVITLPDCLYCHITAASSRFPEHRSLLLQFSITLFVFEVSLSTGSTYFSSLSSLSPHLLYFLIPFSIVSVLVKFSVWFHRSSWTIKVQSKEINYAYTLTRNDLPLFLYLRCPHLYYRVLLLFKYD
jgi:hypothetical protein